MQTFLIQSILNPISRFMGRFSEKSRDRLFLTGGVLILLQMFLRLSKAAEYRYAIHFVSCCVCLVFMLLASLGGEIRPVKFRKSVSILWFAAGILRLISGFRHNVDYLPEAAMLLAVYPVIYLCWRNGDQGRMFRLLGTLGRIAILLYALLSWLLVPIGWNKYAGICTNANNSGNILAVAAISLLLEIFYGNKTKRNILLLGLAVALNFYTNSRSGMLAMLFALVMGLVLYCLTHTIQEIKTCLIRLTAAIFVTLVLILTLVYPFQLRQWLPLPYLDTDDGFFYTASREMLVEKFVPESDPLPEGRVFWDIRGFIHIAEVKNDLSGKDLNAYSTGRVEIWKAYAKDLNWTGHHHVPPVYIGASHTEIKTAHMTALQFGYESGLPMGICYLAMNIATGIWGIVYGWKHREKTYALAPLMYTCVFGLLSMLASCGSSFNYLATLFYYLSLFPIMTRMPEDTL